MLSGADSGYSRRRVHVSLLKNSIDETVLTASWLQTTDLLKAVSLFSQRENSDLWFTVREVKLNSNGSSEVN